MSGWMRTRQEAQGKPRPAARRSRASGNCGARGDRERAEPLLVGQESGVRGDGRGLFPVWPAWSEPYRSGEDQPLGAWRAETQVYAAWGPEASRFFVRGFDQIEKRARSRRSGPRF